MSKIASTAQDMVAGMTPELQPEVYVFVSTNDQAAITALADQAIATFREAEGMSLLLPASVAKTSRFSVEQPMRCITLNVYSSLDGVGLTSAVSMALTAHGIPCNIIAAHHHDHVFVPSRLCDQAVDVLKALQEQANKI